MGSRGSLERVYPTSSVPTLGGSSSERTHKVFGIPSKPTNLMDHSASDGKWDIGINEAEAVLKEAFTCQGHIWYIRPIE